MTWIMDWVPMNASAVNANKPSPTDKDTARQGSCCLNWKSSFPVWSSQMRTVWSADAVYRRVESTAQSQGPRESRHRQREACSPRDQGKVGIVNERHAVLFGAIRSSWSQETLIPASG
jgi:hypothetical protein